MLTSTHSIITRHGAFVKVRTAREIWLF